MNGIHQEDLYLMSLDTEEIHQLTQPEYNGNFHFTQTQHHDNDPSWSPDGTNIAFSRQSGDGRDIFVISASGENLQNITHSSALDYVPSWSQDGS